MQQLILVKHAMPDIQPAIPANRWQLSPAGERQSAVLARHLSPFMPATVISSTEAKAQQTAAIVASHLNIPALPAPNLEEHHRETVGFSTQERFHEAVRRFFAAPTERVFGEGSANEAYTRFSNAISSIIHEVVAQNIIIVTHGTVMSLFASRVAGHEPYGLWKQLGLPSYIVFEIPSLAVTSIVPTIVE